MALKRKINILFQFLKNTRHILLQVFLYAYILVYT